MPSAHIPKDHQADGIYQIGEVKTQPDQGARFIELLDKAGKKSESEMTQEAV
jgi:hypothetical protein